MIELIRPDVLLVNSNPKSVTGMTDIDKIELKLLVWYNEAEEISKFIYSPGPQARFFTNKNKQELTITLLSQPKSPTDSDPRYKILGHSAKRKKKGSDNLFTNVEYRTRGDSTYKQPGKHHDFPISNPTVEVDSIKYTLDLKIHKDDTYITVIVMDMLDGSIIDCDPQAENGTKT